MIPTQLFTTAADLRIFYETSVINDTPDPNETYILFNQVKDLVEDMYKLKIAESVDSSQMANVGDSYLTMKNLPSDYRSTEKLVLTAVSGGSQQIPYYPIAFKTREKYQKIMRKYYIYMKGNQFALCGSVSQAMVINHYYQAYTGQMSLATENLPNPIAWPARFWNILAYGAAAIKQGNFDADAMAFRMSIEQQSVFDTFIVGLLSWDSDLKLQDMNFQGGYADDWSDDNEGNGMFPQSVGLL